MNPAVKTLVDKIDLDELLQGHQAVMVVCWLRACDMSRWLLTALEEFADEQPGIQVAELDVEEGADLCAALEVAETPTLLFFRDGRLVLREIALPARRKADLLRQVRDAKAAWRGVFSPDIPTRLTIE